MKAIAKILVLVAMTAGLVHAEAVNFVAGNWSPAPAGFSAHNLYVYLRDSTLVPVASSNGLYGINTTNTVTMAPTTNAVAGYTDVEFEAKSTVAPGLVGQKNTLTGTPTPTDGEFLYPVGGSAGKSGYCRVFSATNATTAAYYANSPAMYALAAAAAYKSIGGNMTVTNVNPAYVIPFTVPPTNLPASAKISGTVANGSGNNVLPASILTVEYMPTGGVSWTAVTVNGDGSFETGDLVGGNYKVRARVVDAQTPRPGLPLSGEAEVKIVPEPAALFALAGGLLVFLRKK